MLCIRRLPQRNPFRICSHARSHTCRRFGVSRTCSDSHASDPPRKPSLAEQLFPEQFPRHETPQHAVRDVPRIDLEAPFARQRVKQQQQPRERMPTGSVSLLRSARDLERRMQAEGPGEAVLVLRNSSPNLNEEDFRRLVPQGRHIEGWTLDQGSFLSVVPARDLATLARTNAYYLIFSSALSAFTYQGHVKRIHRLAASHTPNSMSDSLIPPPGCVEDGLDVNAAIAAYALKPPSQPLELRLMKPPLTPLLESIVRNRGYARIVHRKGRKPFEVRLTMEGTQLTPSAVRHIIMESGIARARGWTGSGDAAGGLNPHVSRWEPLPSVSPMDNTDFAWKSLRERSEKDQAQRDAARLQPRDIIGGGAEQKRRATPHVYLVGFDTKAAAQSFVYHWHRKPLESPTRPVIDAVGDGDVPPIANVELLW